LIASEATNRAATTENIPTNRRSRRQTLSAVEQSYSMGAGSLCERRSYMALPAHQKPMV